MGGYVQVNELAALVLDEKDHLERLEGQSLHHKQVGRPGAGEFVAKEGMPGQGSAEETSVVGGSGGPIGAHDEAEPQELATNSLRAHRGLSPGSVRCGRALPRAAAGLPSRVLDRHRHYNRQPLDASEWLLAGHLEGSGASRAKPPDQDPEKAVSAPQGEPALRAYGHLELVAQEEVLQDQFVATADGGPLVWMTRERSSGIAEA